jgi:predicted transcriptional regulator
VNVRFAKLNTSDGMISRFRRLISTANIGQNPTKKQVRRRLREETDVFPANQSLLYEVLTMADTGDATNPASATQSSYVDLAADIVSAYVAKNAVPTAELPALIASVHSALNNAVQGTAAKPKEELRPAVPVKKSITPDFLISLEDGKRYKSLKRHLRTSYNMTPDQYRAKWGLPSDYPMVAPNYAKARSQLAKTMGLGQKRAANRKRSKKAA